MEFMHNEKIEEIMDRNVLIIGAGLHGLVTAKVLLTASDEPFASIVIYEKGSGLGGVWASDRIYDGLTTNSPLLTYEMPDFPYPENLRVAGAHVSAQNVNAHLRAYADTYALTERIQYHTLVQEVSWDPGSFTWVVAGTSNGRPFCQSFGYVVVCVGLYHTSLNPLKEPMMSRYNGQIVHSSELGDAHIQAKFAVSRRVAVIGAGKSALDLATILAKGSWTSNGSSAPTVTLVYRKPHWLSPRKIARRSVAFEKVLFSRFINAFLPYVRAPDIFHKWIAETRFGKWQTKLIFMLVADDFVKSNKQQDLPLTIPKHSLSQALSGALHVEPPGYLDCVRSGSIQILEGTVSDLSGNRIFVKSSNDGEIGLKADIILLATGYKLALPFFSNQTCQMLGILRPEDASADNDDLPYVRLYRLIVPPGVAAKGRHQNPKVRSACQNIAFNGFAYSLLNPTVAHVTAHWIADYFAGNIRLPARESVEKEVDEFHAWQTASFGAHGAKGVHIGPHATLYTDSLLADMGLRSGHLELDVWRPIQFLREWFRPMYPEVYSRVEADRKARVKPASASKEVEHDPSFKAPHSAGRVVYKLLLCFMLICILLIWIARYS